MSAANELLQGIYAILAGNAELSALIGPGGIRDRLVSGTELPALVIADLTTNDYSTATEPGEEHFLTLQAWSDAAGQHRAQEIAGLSVAILQNADMPLATHALVNLRHVATRTRREPKTRLFLAEMGFRAVTED